MNTKATNVSQNYTALFLLVHKWGLFGQADTVPVLNWWCRPTPTILS